MGANSLAGNDGILFGVVADELFNTLITSGFASQTGGLFVGKAAVLDITIEQGETYELDFSIDKNDADYSLTGAEIYATLRPSFDSGTSQTFNVTILNEAQGKFRIGLESSNTYALAAGKWKWDCFLHIPRTNEEDQVIRLLNGNATVVPAVTRT